MEVRELRGSRTDLVSFEKRVVAPALGPTAEDSSVVLVGGQGPRRGARPTVLVGVSALGLLI